MKLSVIIPVYHVEATLDRCVTSVLRQDVADNQKLIATIDDPEVFGAIITAISKDAKNEIEKALTDVGADTKAYTKSILTAVA